ncbi:MAG: PEP-CTERM sorting domain-containing protein [Desulfuromonadales bacterium]
MLTKKLVINFVVAALVTIGAGQAQATTYSLNLGGQVANGVSNSYNYNSLHLDDWNLDLTGLQPFTVYNGDQINATIIFDKSVTIQASQLNTWLFLGLYDSGNYGKHFVTETQATTTFYNGGTTGFSVATTIGSEDWLPAGAVLFPPDNGDITFDKLTIDFTISQLGLSSSDSLYLSGATFYTERQSSAPVPEPGTMALLGIGMAGIAIYGKRRRNNKA